MYCMSMYYLQMLNIQHLGRNQCMFVAFPLQALLDALSNNMNAFIVKSGMVQMKQVLLYLLDAVNSCCSSVTQGESNEDDDEALLVAICHNIFPLSLVRLLLGELSEKVFFKVL